ncbi:unnamed protein product [Blepharisma stoltei]|uniref:Cyclic nucleotide-binding domain-containing protein n=1 Tax=Blepharisma stoltei TaxID=1481888 RepID=A0AAU9J1P5_9CILI|nr:unnamed protein product [Blepharisma stoltei]
MKRSTAIEILKENYAHICAQEEISPDDDIWPQNDEEDNRILNFDNCNITDQHLSVVVKALKVDCFFKELILSNNPIGNETISALLKLIESDGSALKIIRLGNGQLNKDLSDDLWYEVSKAEIIQDRSWVIYLGENLLNLESTQRDFKENQKIRSAKSSCDLILDQDVLFNQSLDKDLSSNFVQPEFPNFISRSISPIDYKGADLLDFSCKNIVQVPRYLENTSPKILNLADNKIEKITGIPISILKLSLRGNYLTKIENIDKCSRLRVLDLSNNRIAKVENLNLNFSLQELNLASNQIRVIENLELLKDIRRLNLENNLLSSLMSIRELSFNTKLSFLILRGNPISNEKGYKPLITSLLPKLVVLDYVKVAGAQGTFRRVFDKDNEFFSTPFLSLDRTPESTLRKKNNTTKGQKSKPMILINDNPQIKTSEIPTNFTSPAHGYADTNAETIKKEPLRHNIKLGKNENTKFEPDSSHELAKIRRYFKNVYIFKDIASTFIETLINASQFSVFEEGSIIHHSEVYIEKMIVVYKGKLQHLDRVYGPGASLFADSLIEPEEVYGDVVCIERCEVFILSKTDLDNISKNYPIYRKAYMKNYVEKNVHPNEMDIRSQIYVRRPRKKPFGIKSQSRCISMLNLKSLVTSETSYSLGLISPTKSLSTPLESKIKFEVDGLLKAADPYDVEFSHTIQPTSGKNEIKQAIEKVQKIFEVYKKEEAQEFAKDDAINEAKNYLKNGASDPEIEFLALKRDLLRDCIEKCESDGEEELMTEYIRCLDREENKKLEQDLLDKEKHYKDEIMTCQLTLSSLLSQNPRSFTEERIKIYRNLLDECNLLDLHDDPAPEISEACGIKLEDPKIKEKTDKVMQLIALANNYRTYISEVLDTLESNNYDLFKEIQSEVYEKGLATITTRASVKESCQSSSRVPSSRYSELELKS